MNPGAEQVLQVGIDQGPFRVFNETVGLPKRSPAPVPPAPMLRQRKEPDAGVRRRSATAEIARRLVSGKRVGGGVGSRLHRERIPSPAAKKTSTSV